MNIIQINMVVSILSSVISLLLAVDKDLANNKIIQELQSIIAFVKGLSGQAPAQVNTQNLDNHNANVNHNEGKN